MKGRMFLPWEFNGQGLPGGRFQDDGGFCIAACAARRWSSALLSLNQLFDASNSVVVLVLVTKLQLTTSFEQINS